MAKLWKHSLFFLSLIRYLLMGCTHLKGFFSFPKIRKTENQHKMGRHNLGHKPPQACLHLPIQIGIKYTLFCLGAFWYCFFKKIHARRTSDAGAEEGKVCLWHLTHTGGGTRRWDLPPPVVPSALGTTCIGNVTSPSPAELGRWVRTAAGAKNDKGILGQGQADTLCKDTDAETPEWD